MKPLPSFLIVMIVVAASSAAPADDGDSRPVTEQDVLDPGFETVCPARLIGDAWLGLDSSRMTDVALLLLHGEQTLGRERKAVSADRMVRLAVSAATRNNDQDSLQRLATAAERSGRTELAELAKSSLSLAAASRNVVAGLMIPVDEIGPTEFRQLRSVHLRLRRAVITGDSGQMEHLQTHIDQLHGVAPERRNKLKALIDSSRATMPAKPVVEEDVLESLSLLMAVSRPRGDDEDEEADADTPDNVVGSF